MNTANEQQPWYITTTLPYVNGAPHVGFALELIRADVIARYRRGHGAPVFFNTGTDEHGVKIYEKAAEQGKDPHTFVDEMSAPFRKLCTALTISEDIHFIRTTDEHHTKAAQAFWRRCRDNGYIYKKFYNIKYCKGCELEKTDSELVEGRCPLHPDTPLEHIEEENYFFMFSEFAEKLLVYYQENPTFVTPDFRFNEIKAFIERGLEDFSISRVKEKMPWGIPVPDDEEQVMYVWFDALINYISTLGWPDDEEAFETYWQKGTTVQYAGKDNLRQQAAMWQAMLLAADLPPTDQVVINGFVTVDGEKMSKSKGNVIDPMALVEQYGADAVRYFFIREVHPFEDSDYSEEKFIETYNANLANGLGNVAARILAMAQKYFDGTVRPQPDVSVPITHTVQGVSEELTITGDTISGVIARDIIPAYEEAIATYRLDHALDAIWELIGVLDQYVTAYEPFKRIKEDEQETEAILWHLLTGLESVSTLIAPFLPTTAHKLSAVVSQDADDVFSVSPLDAPLFPRL